MTDSHLGEEPAEHLRFAEYLTALEAVAEADEAELVATVLRDEDATMAQSAVVAHLDRRAVQHLSDPRFDAWARTMAGVIAGRDFLARRLNEWTLLSRIALGKPWDNEELIAASDWCQRTATTGQITISPEALGLLAEHGRTRRVRNGAGHRLQHPDRPS